MEILEATLVDRDAALTQENELNQELSVNLCSSCERIYILNSEMETLRARLVLEYKDSDDYT